MIKKLRKNKKKIGRERAKTTNKQRNKNKNKYKSVSPFPKQLKDK